MPLTFTRAVKPSAPATPATAVTPSDIDGVWQGTLDLGGTKLRIVFHLTNTKDGLAATLDSPDQGAMGLPVTSAKREGSTLTLEMPALGAKFQGAIAKDLSAIDGTFTQGGATLPLTLKRAADAK